MSEFKEQLKQDIAEELKLLSAFEKIQYDTPLFSNPYITIDSMDALRIVVMLEKKYGVRIENYSQKRNILYSVDTIAEYIQANKPKANVDQGL
jgi:acyl carrier protein